MQKVNLEENFTKSILVVQKNILNNCTKFHEIILPISDIILSLSLSFSIKVIYYYVQNKKKCHSLNIFYLSMLLLVFTIWTSNFEVTIHF